jgi:hypothetical protein
MSKKRPTDDALDESKKVTVDIVESSSAKPSDLKYSTRLALPRGSDFQAYKILTYREPISLDAEGSMYFRNYDESRVPMLRPQWHAPLNDSSLPQSDADDRSYVRLLVTAFRSVEHANDSPKSQYIGRLKATSDFYQPWAIEACAWNILVRSLHSARFVLRLIYNRMRSRGFTSMASCTTRSSIRKCSEQWS